MNPDDDPLRAPNPVRDLAYTTVWARRTWWEATRIERALYVLAAVGAVWLELEGLASLQHVL